MRNKKEQEVVDTYEDKLFHIRVNLIRPESDYTVLDCEILETGHEFEIHILTQED